MGVRVWPAGRSGNGTCLPVGRPGARPIALRPRRAGVGAIVALGALVLALTAWQGTAAAGDGPYGSTTTTTGEGGPQPSCQLRGQSMAPGETVTAQVKAVPRGSHVEIRFDGEVVAEEDATGPGNSPRVNMEIDFVVPADAAPGEHEVTAVGAEFNVSCRAPNGESARVLSGSVTADDEASGGSLPRTGVYIALLLVIGLVLVLVGRVALAVSRRRVHDVHGGPRYRSPSRH